MGCWSLSRFPRSFSDGIVNVASNFLWMALFSRLLKYSSYFALYRSVLREYKTNVRRFYLKSIWTIYMKSNSDIGFYCFGWIAFLLRFVFRKHSSCRWQTIQWTRFYSLYGWTWSKYTIKIQEQLLCLEPELFYSFYLFYFVSLIWIELMGKWI